MTTTPDSSAGWERFLGAHVAYVAAFAPHRRAWRTPGTVRRLAPVVAAWASVVPALSRRAGRLRVPVALYGTAIAVMQASALLLDDRLSARGRARIATGAACFMVSDALIGARRFLLPARYGRAADVGVMATYVTAQWLITDGVLRTSGGRRRLSR